LPSGKFIGKLNLWSVISFTTSGKANFPYTAGITQVNYQKIIQNIKLQKGLNAKYMQKYLNERKKRIFNYIGNSNLIILFKFFVNSSKI